MSKRFNIKNCPICGKLLVLSYIGGGQPAPAYRCPEKYVSPSFTDNHYKIITWFKDDFDVEHVAQETILPPYFIRTIIDSGRTKVFALPKPDDVIILDGNGQQLFSLIMEVPTIVPEDPEKMRKKIKMLVPFS